MSNETITLPVEIIGGKQYGPEQGTGEMRFQRDTLRIGTTHMDVYTPQDGRKQHVGVVTHGATLNNVTAFSSHDGEHSVTLNLTVDGRSVEIALWGVTLDTLAVAVEAAQRGSEADAWHCDECGEVCDTPGAVSSEHAAGCSLNPANIV